MARFASTPHDPSRNHPAGPPRWAGFPRRYVSQGDTTAHFMSVDLVTLHFRRAWKATYPKSWNVQMYLSGVVEATHHALQQLT